MTNKKHGTLYIGVTNHLERRVFEHKHKILKGFTSKYNLDKLVYYQAIENIYPAIEYEKYLKSKKRKFKIACIEENNPKWNDIGAFW